MSGCRLAARQKGLSLEADCAEWVTEVRAEGDDFRGRAVHGTRGERFVYLTWGTVDIDLTDDAGMPRCARLDPPAVRIG